MVFGHLSPIGVISPIVVIAPQYGNSIFSSSRRCLLLERSVVPARDYATNWLSSGLPDASTGTHIGFMPVVLTDPLDKQKLTLGG